MNARWFTVLSVLLNLGLVAGIVKVSQRDLTLPTPKVESAVSVAATRNVPAAEVASAPTPETIVEKFLWRQVADVDFKKYRDQLLELGCPENTMRVILLCEINEQFGQKRRAALALVQAQFWDLMVEGPDKVEKQAREATKVIEDERRKLIDEVAGEKKPDEAELAANKARAEAAQRARYAWLPEEKRAQMVALDKELEEANAEMWRLGRENKDRQPTAVAKAKQKELEQQIKLARQQLLTPEESGEYELRSSNAANWALSAAGFEPTEDEWRQVTKLQKQHNDALEGLNASKPANDEEKRARAAETQRLNDELAKVRDTALGPERSAEYARANDRDFRQVRTVIQKYGLDDSVAQQVYELQRIAMKQADALRNNKSFDADARNAALVAVQQETERTLQQTMGAKAFNTYKKYDEGWFGRLGRR